MNPPSQPLHLKAGTVLFRPEDECPGFVRVGSGSIKVSLTSAEGREVVLYRVKPGEVCLQTFSCLINRNTYSAEGVVEEDLEGELIAPGVFRERLQEDGAFRDEVFAAIALRFSDFEHLIEDIALMGFDVRLARALLRLADSSAVVHATHDALAAEIASGRAVVTRHLGEFARKGWVELSRGEVRLVDPARLKLVAGDDTA